MLGLTDRRATEVSRSRCWQAGPALRLIAALALILQGCAKPLPPASRPPPTYGTDGCGYWERANGGRLFFFQPGTVQPVDTYRYRTLLDELVVGTREDPGTLLIQGYVSETEVKAGHTQLALARARYLRDALIARGFPERAIWIGEFDSQNPFALMRSPVDREHAMFASVLNVAGGNACLASRRHARREWFARNCFPMLHDRVNDCFVTLRKMDEGGD
jgi:hypothetical protein